MDNVIYPQDGQQPSTSKQYVTERENTGDERGDQNDGDDRKHRDDRTHGEDREHRKDNKHREHRKNNKHRDDRKYESDSSMSMSSDQSLERESNEPTNNAIKCDLMEMKEMLLNLQQHLPRCHRLMPHGRQRKTIGRRKKPAHRREPKQPKRRKPKRRVSIKVDKRELSQSTIFTRLSSVGSVGVCSRCGHRCCQRRFEYELSLRYCEKCRKRVRIFPENKPIHRKRKEVKHRNRKEVEHRTRQVEHRKRKEVKPIIKLRSGEQYPCSIRLEELNEDYSFRKREITPEMIVETLRQLEMWERHVKTTSIRNHLSRNYPVNKNMEALLDELVDKLTICVTIGIVRQEPKESWRLNSELESRKLTPNHVTLFWKLYADKLRPVVDKTVKKPEEETEKKDQDSGVNRDKEKTLMIIDEDIL